MRIMVGKLRRKLGDNAQNLTCIFTEPRAAIACRRARNRATGNVAAARAGSDSFSNRPDRLTQACCQDRP